MALITQARPHLRLEPQRSGERWSVYRLLSSGPPSLKSADFRSTLTHQAIPQENPQAFGPDVAARTAVVE